MASSVTSDGEEASPSEGDITLCIECGQLCRFDADLKMVKPTAEQMIIYLTSPEVRALLRVWRMIRPTKTMDWSVAPD